MKIIEFNNIKFLVGQNAKENWKILDEANNINQNYIWFHLDSFPSPYVIMMSTINDLEKESNTVNDYINFGANLCKEYSKYKYLNDLKIMYVPIHKLFKSDIIGEVIVNGKSKIIKI